MPVLRRRTLSLLVTSSLLGGLLVGLAAGEEPPAPAQDRQRAAAVELVRPTLPAGSTARGAAGAEDSALRLAQALAAVPLDPTGALCPGDRLRVSWDEPLPGEYLLGGYLAPLGPPPGPETTVVNGVVACDGAHYAYMGFEARWAGTRWEVVSVPALGDEVHLEQEHAHDEEGDFHDQGTGLATAAPAARAAGTGSAPATGFVVPGGLPVDPYAGYDPQRVCDPVAKPGTVALRDLLLSTYPGTRSLGVTRTCGAGGTSEHKEGRAFDWGVDVRAPAERAAAESVLAQLLATDAAGNPHALARRLGVMYVIWDRQIWSAYGAGRGWRPYSGASPHTDHVHLSLSWDGAMGRTSYWSGANADLLRYDPSLRLVDAPGGASRDTALAVRPVASTDDQGRRAQAAPEVAVTALVVGEPAPEPEQQSAPPPPAAVPPAPRTKAVRVEQAVPAKKEPPAKQAVPGRRAVPVRTARPEKKAVPVQAARPVPTRPGKGGGRADGKGAGKAGGKG